MKTVKIEVMKKKEKLTKDIEVPNNLIEAVEKLGEQNCFDLLESAIIEKEKKKLLTKRVNGKKYLKIDLTKLKEEQIEDLKKSGFFT